MSWGAGDSALILFGQAMRGRLLEMPESELLALEPEHRMEGVVFRALSAPASGFPDEAAAVAASRPEEDIVEAHAIDSVAEVLGGGIPEPSAEGRKGAWRFATVRHEFELPCPPLWREASSTPERRLAVRLRPEGDSSLRGRGPLKERCDGLVAPRRMACCVARRPGTYPRSCPEPWCKELGTRRGVRRARPGISGCHGKQLDGEVVADGSDRFQRHVSPCDGPFVVLLEQNRADEACDGVLVGEDADDVAPRRSSPRRPDETLVRRRAALQAGRKGGTVPLGNWRPAPDPLSPVSLAHALSHCTPSRADHPRRHAPPPQEPVSGLRRVPSLRASTTILAGRRGSGALVAQRGTQLPLAARPDHGRGPGGDPDPVPSDRSCGRGQAQADGTDRDHSDECQLNGFETLLEH